MRNVPSPEPEPSTRADARRNRRRLLDAAIELILELGGEPSRDAVAQRAGTGIATLYRHFPDRQDLLRAVVLEVLDRVIDEGRAALAEAPGGAAALRRYLHAAIDHGLGVVNIVHPILDDTEWPDRADAARVVLGRLVAAARREGAIDKRVTAAEVARVAIRFSRPLAVGLDPVQERTIAHRQLDTYLDGLFSR